MNVAGEVVLEVCQCGALRSVPERALTDGRNLAGDLDRLAKDVIRTYSTQRPMGRGRLTAYWTEGGGRDRLVAAEGWCAPQVEARGDDLWPAPATPRDRGREAYRRLVQPEPEPEPQHHWGEYDEWLAPTDREFLETQWKAAGGVVASVDTSWVTTVPEHRSPGRLGWALMLGFPLGLALVVIVAGWLVG